MQHTIVRDCIQSHLIITSCRMSNLSAGSAGICGGSRELREKSGQGVLDVISICYLAMHAMHRKYSKTWLPDRSEQRFGVGLTDRPTNIWKFRNPPTISSNCLNNISVVSLSSRSLIYPPSGPHSQSPVSRPPLSYSAKAMPNDPKKSFENPTMSIPALPPVARTAAQPARPVGGQKKPYPFMYVETIGGG